MSWLVSAFADEAGPSIDEQIKALKKAGLKHIDPRSVEGHNITTLPVDIAGEVARKLKDAGIAVHMFGSPLGKIDISEDLKIDLDKLRHLGTLSGILGCNKVRIFSYYNKQNVEHAKWQAESIARLQTLSALARELGLVLYHENERHIWGDTLAQVKTLVPLRNDQFKLIFDFDNYNQSGDDVWQNWVELREVTDAFHLKDSTRDADGKCQHVPAGQGNGQIEKILADALARGWNGPLVLEPHLKHSGAVAATGPSGQTNQAFKDMTHAECFQVAAEAGLKLLGKIKAPVA